MTWLWQRAAARTVAAFGIGIALAGAVGAQQGAAVGAAGQPPPQADIVVIGKKLEELRIQIERAEDDVYARFNELNSNDLYDIHCYERVQAGSRIERRTCQSNSWRKMDEAIGLATVQDLQSASTGVATGMDAAGTPQSKPSGGYSHVPQQYRAKQQHTEQLVVDEMKRLARQDPELKAAMVRLGQAYQAEELLTGSKPEWTLYREVTAGEQGLPFGAQHVFEVRIGASEWRQELSTRTFTIAGVDGRIRRMRVACDKADRDLEYKEGSDWTIPAGWGACTLSVDAKRGTTFSLYEFE